MSDTQLYRRYGTLFGYAIHDGRWKSSRPSHRMFRRPNIDAHIDSEAVLAFIWINLVFLEVQTCCYLNVYIELDNEANKLNDNLRSYFSILNIVTERYFSIYVIN